MTLKLLVLFELIRQVLLQNCEQKECRVCENDIDRCISCVPGYRLTESGGCEQNHNKFCRILIPKTDQCRICIDGYYEANGKCLVQSIPECEVYISNYNKCLEYKKTELIETRIMASLPPNCSTGTSLGCSICSKGFYLIESNNTCVPGTVPNCFGYQTNQNVCGICKNLYWLNKTDYSCRPVTVTHCNISEVNDNFCKTCENGYYLNDADELHFNASVQNGECLKQDIPNCDILEPNEGRCLNCSVNYKLADFKTKCILAFIANCNSISSLGFCNKCNSTYYLQNNACLPIPDINCNSTDGLSKTCTTCKPGFYFNYTLTTCMPQSIGNCTIYKNNVNACLNCSTGFYVNGGFCFPQGGPNCTSFAVNTNKCLACKQGFVVVGPLCHVDGSINCLPGLYNSTTNFCLGCPNMFFINKDDPGCQPMCHPIQDLTCKTSVYNLNKCQECKSGYFPLNWGPILCQKQNLLYCNKYVPNQNNCSVCDPGYAVVKGQCYVDNAPSCDAYINLTNVCTNCTKKFFKDSTGRCVPITDPACATNILNKNQCQNCTAGYFPDSNKFCQAQNVTNCSQHQLNVNLCATCNIGYVSTNNGKTCVLYVAPNCGTMNPTNTACVTCKAGFYLDSNKNCTKQLNPGCNTFAVNQNICLSCKSDMYIDANGICQNRTVTNCKTYSNNTNTCVNCSAGYTLNANNTCSLTPIPNCINQALTVCSKCNIGFYLKSNACAPMTGPNIANCLKQDGIANACQLCPSLQFIEKGGCSYISNNLTCVSSNGVDNQCSSCPAGKSLVATLYPTKVPIVPCCTLSQIPVSVAATCKSTLFSLLNACLPNTLPTNCLYCSNGFPVSISPGGMAASIFYIC